MWDLWWILSIKISELIFSKRVHFPYRALTMQGSFEKKTVSHKWERWDQVLKKRARMRLETLVTIDKMPLIAFFHQFPRQAEKFSENSFRKGAEKKAAGKMRAFLKPFPRPSRYAHALCSLYRSFINPTVESEQPAPVIKSARSRLWFRLWNYSPRRAGPPGQRLTRARDGNTLSRQRAFSINATVGFSAFRWRNRRTLLCDSRLFEHLVNTGRNIQNFCRCTKI